MLTTGTPNFWCPCHRNMQLRSFACSTHGQRRAANPALRRGTDAASELLTGLNPGRRMTSLAKSRRRARMCVPCGHAVAHDPTHTWLRALRQGKASKKQHRLSESADLSPGSSPNVLANARRRVAALRERLHDALWHALPTYAPTFNTIPPVQSDMAESATRVGPYTLGVVLGKGKKYVTRAATREAGVVSTTTTRAGEDERPTSVSHATRPMCVRMIIKDRLSSVRAVKSLSDEIRVRCWWRARW